RMSCAPCATAGLHSSGSPRTPDMSSTAPNRRPIDLSGLETRVRGMRLRGVIDLPSGRGKVSLTWDHFVPRIQAEVGSALPVGVYRYRLLVPVAQITQESAQVVRRALVATTDEIEQFQNMFVRHFGGVTVHHQTPSAIRGVGARDPSDVVGPLE